MTTEASPADPSTAPDRPVDVSDRGIFEAYLETNDIVLVEFYTDWCGLCQRMEPVIGGLAANTSWAVLTVDVDDARELADEFDITGVPTIVVFVDGQKTEAVVGVRSYDELEALLAGYTD